MEEIKCAACQAEEMQANKNQEEIKQKEETDFAILLALVPAMTMSVFNLMGLF